MKVSADTVVSLRYIMKNKQGEILEDRMHTTAVNYLHGAENILPALEACLEGLETGQKKSISISNEISRELNDQFYFDIIIDDVRQATEEELQKRKPDQPTTGNKCEPGCSC